MPDPANAIGDSSHLWLLLTPLLLLCTALCAAAETAALNFSENALRRMADGGNQKAARILDRLEDPTPTVQALHTGQSLTTLLNALLLGGWCSERLHATLLAAYPALVDHSELIMFGLLVLMTLAFAYVLLVLGELVPARVGTHHPETVLLKTFGFWRFYTALNRLPAALFSGTARLIARLFGVAPEAEEAVTEEDILQMVDVGEETGAIEESQKDMIENIFAFDDITADQLMTPRTDVAALDVTDSVADALAIVVEEGYSRIPLYEQDIDHIIGVLYAKDLLPFVGQLLPPELTLAELSHETYFVPGTKRCGELFSEMSERHLQMAIVVDEYGGVAGIVTMEDLLESIVGNIQDEFDDEEEEVKKTGEDSFEVDGSMSMDELCELWEITPPEGEFETVAGFLLSELGRIPTADEAVQVEFDRLTLTVLSMDDRRIERIHVQVKPLPQEDEETEK
ncbi:MAG: HlyC/CorC family transporter [Ruminococcaceae bacterium]|nr:HlyC/CorC family transporter [Oscillospiraceae bacterium]MBQ2781003.1 HlyC/CorC family transporter [Clostridia bacterium]MBQ7302980.1 HlyC/CorC family transporter [Clostridia bacterium]MBQ7303285.1 HlyC/CorC family transporter [Clostridia bacterium]